MTDHTPMTCDRFDALLSDYLEGTLAEGDRAAVERHARSCARCGALVTDLESIARDARALPDLHPSRDLWPGIAERIEPAVVELPRGARDAGRGMRGAGRRWRWASLAAAALLLAAASSGITYLAMRHQSPGTPGTYAVVPDSAVRSVLAPGGRTPASGDSGVGLSRPAPRVPRPAPRAALVGHPTVEHVYDQEIAQLERIVHDRRSQLDTATIAVIERNLGIIDRAIAQSREALAKDPRSRFLNDQLNSALDQKVELLRTVALLPPRT
jgi:Putative zinc-finger